MVDLVLIDDCHPPDKYEDAYIELSDVNLSLSCYTPHEAVDKVSNCDDSMAAVLNTSGLPNTAHNGLWQSLHFEDSRHSRLLHKVSRMMGLFRDGELNATLHNWYKIVLL